jgi:hypothetical protein
MATSTPQAADGGPGAADPAAIAAAARRKDPGLPVETAELLANQLPQLLSEAADDGAPGLARALLAANPDVGATACNVVATAAVEHLSHPEPTDPA